MFKLGHALHKTGVEMLLKIAKDNEASFKNNNARLIHHPKDTLTFTDLGNVWSELKTIYNGDFKNLVYGELPREEAVLETLKMIQKRLRVITWTIKINYKE